MATDKKIFKEKIALLYENLFTKQPMELLTANPDYWDEFFLLKPSRNALESSFNDALCNVSKAKDTVNLLFSQCTVALKEDSNIRISNAIMTLCVLSRIALHNKKHPFSAIDILMGKQDADLKFEVLRTRFCELLYEESPVGMKSLIIEFLLILITQPSQLSDNAFAELMMSEHLFDALMPLLSTPQTRQSIGYKTVLLLTLLVNTKLNKNVNPFVVKLSIIQKEVALIGYAYVVSQALQEFNKQYDEKIEEPKTAGFFSSFTSLVGNMFIADDDNGLISQPKPVIKPSYSVLLAFYEAIHLNRNFITLLTNSPSDLAETSSEVSDSDGNQANSISPPPPNLLVTFLEFCSIVMVNTKDEQNLKSSRLCFILLLCISEDQCANAIMHDPNIAFRVQLRRSQMRHRRIADDITRPTKPMYHAVLDLMTEFILSNLRKTLPLELYAMSLSVVQRVLCYQKKCGVRLDYCWSDLWSSLITLLKFLISHESDLLPKTNIFSLTQHVCNIFNLFITFGDTFLPSAEVYDQLYYEIIRMNSVFDNLYLLALRHSSTDGGKFKESSLKTVSALANIKAIINHFSPKIDAWSEKNEIESITEADVLEVVRDNYDSLTLKLQEGLDSYEPYNADSPKESIFFLDIGQSVIREYQQQDDQSDKCLITEYQLLVKLIMETNQSTQ
ncbi:UPF0588 membrane protein C20F10.02c [Halotydeus destructor]|nr:UPF0588 membrane protein C20F10.02c [Halotydeus destructor]